MKYEMIHQAIKLVQSNNPLFIRKENGEVETRFLVAPLEKKNATVFPTQIAMLHPVSYVMTLRLMHFVKMENLASYDLCKISVESNNISQYIYIYVLVNGEEVSGLVE